MESFPFIDSVIKTLSWSYEIPVEYQVICPLSYPVQPEVGLYAHLFQSALMMIPLFLIDFLILKRVSSLSDSKTRWFALHAIANGIIAVSSLPDVTQVLGSPFCSMLNPMQSWVPSHTAVAVHSYHFLAFTKIRLDDLMHLIVFVGLLNVPNFLLSAGSITNLVMFFMTGLPGGLTYLMLVLVKLGVMASIREKEISADINTYLRSPALVYCGTSMLASAVQGASRPPIWIVFVCGLVTIFNGIYYGRMAQDNYTENRVQQQFESRNKS